MARKALYLAGGGARGAYQVGVLKAIEHILQVKKVPFEMISGVSIGSINAAVFSQHADDFPMAVETLESLWRSIHCGKIFNTSNYELGKSVLRNFSHFIIKQRNSGFLLNTEPLHELISQIIDFEKIKENIITNQLETLEVISNCYETQQTISFYQHTKEDFEDWHSPRHLSKPVDMGMQHILASSALPLFFPTVKINGYHYGDGSMGLVSPLRGAVKFNVEKILILGTRQLPIMMENEPVQTNEIGFAQVLGNMLNGLFLDNLDRDIEMLNRMNDIARLLSIWKKRYSPWRPIETLHLRPSIDLATIAQANYQTMPAVLRLLLNFLGAQSHSGDLLSFLLFEKDFTGELVDLGYEDTMASSSVVEAFFKGD